jgi:peptidoglycan/xylan/chitin deacetylase (PgdA/CDA1 family)
MVDRILDTLAARRVTATFFVQGRWATAYPAVASRIVRDGHLLGNHSHWHAPMPLLSSEGIERDVRRAEASLIRTTGVDPRPWFRCPFGEGRDDQRVLDQLGRLGYRNVHWDVAADDWLDDASPSLLQETIVSQSRRSGDSAVVLLHTWPKASAESLPGILNALSSTGTRFVRLNELVAQD